MSDPRSSNVTSVPDSAQRSHLTFVAVEKDLKWQRILIELLAHTPSVELLGLMTDREIAFDLARTRKIDVILLDLPKSERFDLRSINGLPSNTAVIVSTDHPDLAATAFDLGIADLMLKPYELARLQKAIAKATSQILSSGRETFSNGPNSRRSISIRSGRRSMYVPLEEILWIEAIGNHVSIHLQDRELQANCTMKKMESLLEPGQFTRVHRSYIVADRIVKELDRSTLFTTQGEIPIGTAYRKIVLRSFDLDRDGSL